MRQGHRVAIGLGTNLGDRLANLQAAAAALVEDLLENPVASSVYETEPWGILDQPKFLNAVMIGETDFKPPAILNLLKQLEQSLGRTTTVKNGPRVIDLDLLAFGEEAWSSEGLVVPHPGLAERDFVLVPFCDVWPNWQHPGLKRSAETLKLALQKNSPQGPKRLEAHLLGTKTP